MAEPLQQIVIVGGGVAAQRCAFALRKRGFEGELTMVSAEEEPPYDRTLLSKDMLRGAPGEPCRALQPAEAYADRDIDLRLGVAAAGLDVEAQRVALSDGAELAYDQLVICSGGRPVLPAALTCPGVLLLRETADLEALHAQLADVTRLAIVGGGFIGGEVASSAVARGLEVTLIEAAPQPLAPVLGEEVGARVADLHRAHGVDVVAGAAVEGIAERDGGFELDLRRRPRARSRRGRGRRRHDPGGRVARGQRDRARRRDRDRCRLSHGRPRTCWPPETARAGGIRATRP